MRLKNLRIFYRSYFYHLPSDPSESMEQVVIAFSGGMSTSQRFATRGLKSPASRLKNVISLFDETNSKLYFRTCS